MVVVVLFRIINFPNIHNYNASAFQKSLLLFMMNKIPSLNSVIYLLIVTFHLFLKRTDMFIYNPNVVVTRNDTNSYVRVIFNYSIQR